MASAAGLISKLLLPAMVAHLILAAHSMPLPQPITLEGEVLRQSGNTMPGSTVVQPAPAQQQEVVVLAGTVKPQQLGDPLLPQQAVTAPVLLRSRSDSQGRLVLHLPTINPQPQRVTVMLVVPGGYYLNRFDHQGDFASLVLPDAAKERLLLVDDRQALH